MGAATARKLWPRKSARSVQGRPCSERNIVIDGIAVQEPPLQPASPVGQGFAGGGQSPCHHLASDPIVVGGGA